MGTIQMRFVLLTACLLLPACYGQYVVAHELAPPGDIWIDPHRALAFVTEESATGLEIPLEARTARADSGVCLLFGSEAMLDDPARLRSMPCGGPGPLALTESREVQSVRGTREPLEDAGRLWSEQVSLDWSAMRFFSAPGIVEATDAAEGNVAPLWVVLRMPDGRGLYRLEPREAERLGLASSSLMGIGILGVLTVWWGNR